MSHQQPYPSGRFQLVEPATALRNDDDTDHALLPILSYLHSNGIVLSPEDFALRLRHWSEPGLREINKPTYTLNPKPTAYTHWSTTTNHTAAPNGSLMRTHPLGIFCLGLSVEETFRTAAEVRAETDVVALVERVAGWVERWLEVQSPEFYDGVVLDRVKVARYVSVRRFGELVLDDALRMGYVFRALGAGMGICEEIITELVMHGGDADTNACVAGALLGALLGFTALPSRWRDGLEHRAWLLRKCGALASTVGVVEGEAAGYIGSEDPDTGLDVGRGTLGRRELEAREMALMEAYLNRKTRLLKSVSWILWRDCDYSRST
ncbi:ADP-ribosylglycohydrolase family protein [Aspergillus homomorphus CBS 101889]|uniref:ADP-ribosylglycohydrolase n=1 Tax=Aspergillus homomorphus (strain CBS 101889) TaxID=1450537 RepID=A0A395IBJ8_ASPHC|nr:ADP-ribosylglycohydrolase [Aspergillus homomorphus CBS 101889]RAL17602.1 ADP-ribosylglycohydrolase [Aspergillus homomorphus CBS 101889]